MPGSAGLGNYRFAAAKNLGPNVDKLGNNAKLKSNKDISSFSPSSKPVSSMPNPTLMYSPQAHKGSLMMQNSEKVISVK